MPLNKKKSSRREFIIQSSKTAVGIAALGAFTRCAAPNPAPMVTGGVIGANDRINMAVVGIRSRGVSHMKGFAKLNNVHIKTIVDIDTDLLKKRLYDLDKIQDEPPKIEQDIRRVLDDKNIDAISIATPDHWHALATIWACQAGKHVYVEKPCSHNIWEGGKMVEAAIKYNCIVSAGYQNRSIKNVRAAMKFLHDGGIGDVYMAKGLCFKPRDSIGSFPDSEVPNGVDYDMWLGCAPKRPFNKNRFHYNWHWFWDYGCGDIGNQGPHQFDIARWGLNKDEHPVKVRSSGHYYMWDSDQETPNTQTATLEYADGKTLCFEVRGGYTNAEDGIKIGNLFYGTKGWMHLNQSSWATYFGRKNEPGPTSKSADDYADPNDLAGTGGGGHYENFIRALRENNKKLLTCNIEDGHISTALPHLANIAYRVDGILDFDGATEKFINNEGANALLTRNYRGS